MEIQGKIIAKLDPQGGMSKAGREWKKQEYVLETHDSFPRKVKFDFFGDRVDQFPLEIGDEVSVSYDLESREFNGRWYTDVRAWKAEKGVGMPSGPAPMGGASMSASMPADPFSSPAPQNPGAPAAQGFGAAPAPVEDAGDDLPF